MSLQTTGFYHHVYFYLTDAPNAAANIAVGCRKHLSGIPGVLRLELGKTAGTNRPVVDNDYGLALLVEFENAAAHDVYQDHPDHHTFIAECKANWTHVKVYDSVPFA